MWCSSAPPACCQWPPNRPKLAAGAHRQHSGASLRRHGHRLAAAQGSAVRSVDLPPHLLAVAAWQTLSGLFTPRYPKVCALPLSHSLHAAGGLLTGCLLCNRHLGRCRSHRIPHTALLSRPLLRSRPRCRHLPHHLAVAALAAARLLRSLQTVEGTGLRSLGPSAAWPCWQQSSRLSWGATLACWLPGCTTSAGWLSCWPCQVCPLSRTNLSYLLPMSLPVRSTIPHVTGHTFCVSSVVSSSHALLPPKIRTLKI